MFKPARWIAPTLIAALLALANPNYADAAPADVLLGHWTLAAERPNASMPGAHCTISEILFQPNVETWIDRGNVSKARLLGYSMNGADVQVVVSTGAVDQYKIINANKIEYQGISAACAYSRIHQQRQSADATGELPSSPANARIFLR